MITSRAASRKNSRGGILIEAVVALGIVSLALFLNLDLIRRVQLAVVFHHGSFLAVRERILGESDRRAKAVVRDFWVKALGEAGRWHFVRSDHDEKEGNDFLRRSSSGRYEAFLPFRFGDKNKHHFEVTEACKFSLAR